MLQICCAARSNRMSMKAVGFEELVRLVSHLIGEPDSNAVQDGLSLYFEQGILNAGFLTWMVFFRKTGRLLKVSELLDNDIYARQNHYISWPIIGQFTKWLIVTFGMDKYLAFYRYKDSAEGLKAVYGKDVSEMDRMRLEFTMHYDIDSNALKGLEELIRKVTVQGKKQ